MKEERWTGWTSAGTLDDRLNLSENRHEDGFNRLWMCHKGMLIKGYKVDLCRLLSQLYTYLIYTYMYLIGWFELWCKNGEKLLINRHKDMFFQVRIYQQPFTEMDRTLRSEYKTQP